MVFSPKLGENISYALVIVHVVCTGCSWGDFALLHHGML